MGHDARIYRVPAAELARLRRERKLRRLVEQLTWVELESGRTELERSVAATCMEADRCWSDLPVLFEAVDELNRTPTQERSATAYQTFRRATSVPAKDLFALYWSAFDVLWAASEWHRVATALDLRLPIWRGPPQRLDHVRKKQEYAAYELVDVDALPLLFAELEKRLPPAPPALEYPLAWSLETAQRFVQALSLAARNDEGIVVIRSA